MTGRRRIRRLTVGDTTWLWSVRHKHPNCREVLSLHREGAGVTLRIVFRAGPGRYLADGLRHSGSVSGNSGNSLNLHEPGVVRQLLDAAECFAPSTEFRETELDGWQLFGLLVND